MDASLSSCGVPDAGGNAAARVDLTPLFEDPHTRPRLQRILQVWSVGKPGRPHGLKSEDVNPLGKILDHCEVEDLVSDMEANIETANSLRYFVVRWQDWAPSAYATRTS